MTNNQFGFTISAPSNAYGVSTDFIVPNGISIIAAGAKSLWASAGDIVANESLLGGGYNEASLTYFAQGNPQGLTPGWYFYWGADGNTNCCYLLLGHDPTGNLVRLTLQYVNGTNYWKAIYYNISTGNIIQNNITNPATGGYAMNHSTLQMEAGDNPTCSTYSQFNDLTFRNITYYDINQNPITYTYTVTGVINNTDTCTACLTENTTNTTITYHGC